MTLQHRRRMATRRMRTGRVLVVYRRGLLIVPDSEPWPWRKMLRLHRTDADLLAVRHPTSVEG